nr:hypothetical protein [Parabacteroides merdae]
MNVQETKEQLIAELIRLAFAEDIGDGDHTTLCCIPATEMGKSQLIVKEDGVLAGVEMAERIFHTFDPDLKMTRLFTRPRKWQTPSWRRYGIRGSPPNVFLT